MGVLRLLRLLRIMKMVKTIPQLAIIVTALLKSLGSIFYIFVLVALVLYVFGILGMMLFAENDPWHFGSLHRTVFTLWRVSTFEDWTDIMYINMFGCSIYFILDDQYAAEESNSTNYDEE